jgi:hypothetical protein
MSEFKETKRIRELREGDCISVSGYEDDAAEIEEINPIGTCIWIKLSNGQGRIFGSHDLDKKIVCYKI